MLGLIPTLVGAAGVARDQAAPVVDARDPEEAPVAVAEWVTGEGGRADPGREADRPQEEAGRPGLGLAEGSHTESLPLRAGRGILGLGYLELVAVSGSTSASVTKRAASCPL